MKKLTLITMFFVLLLGTRCQALSSARATFFGKHECHAAGSHAQRCRINSGDTLSKDALAVYGDWHLYSTILMGANPQIVDANKIYAGKWIIIPDQPTSVVKTVAVLTPEKMAISAPADISTENHFSPLPSPEAPASIPVPVEKPVPTSTQIVIALDPKVSAASIVTQPPIVAQPPPTPKEVRAKTTKPKKVSGYRFVIPNSHAFISDGTPIIPMGLDLPTQVGIFNKADDVENNISPLKTVNVVSRAEAIKGKDRDVALSVSLTQLPDKPFILYITGIGSIDGKEFSRHAQPIHGSFPGKHHFLRISLTASAIGVNGLLLTELSGNPVLGFGVAGGAWGVHALIHHYRMAAEKRAELKFEQTRERLLLVEKQNTQQEGHSNESE